MIFTQLCLGVHWIHYNNIIHRDLKPSNILLYGPIYKIGDFGICKEIDPTKLTITKTSGIGTPYYWAPEQASGKKYDNSVDIFSLGIIFYLLVTKTLPFSNFYELLIEEPPAISTDIPMEISSMISKMLSKNPK